MSAMFFLQFGWTRPAVRSSLILSPADFRSAGAGNPIAAWVNTGSTSTEEKVIEDSATSLHRVLQDVTTSGTVTNTWQIYARSGERSVFWLVCQNNAANDGGQAKFDLGAMTTSGASTFGLGSSVSSAIQRFPRGWFLCTLRVNCGSGTAVRMAIVLDNGAGTTYAGNGASGLYLRGAYIQPGA